MHDPRAYESKTHLVRYLWPSSPDKFRVPWNSPPPEGFYPIPFLYNNISRLPILSSTSNTCYHLRLSLRMQPLTLFIPLLCTLLALCLLHSVQGRPRVLSKQERIANLLSQKPMHTTALLAGAAAMPTPSPYPPGSSDLGYTQRPPQEADEELDLDDGNQYE